MSRHLEGVNALAFRPAAVATEGDAGLVPVCATGSDDRTLRVWQPETGRMVRIIRQHRGAILALAFAPDGRSFFSAGSEGVVRQFDSGSDALLREWPGPAEWIYSLAVHPDGTKLAAGDWSGAVRVIDLRVGR
jgi:WD40 repeat protein